MTFLDMAITAKVKSALLHESQINATDINVNTRDGVVTLSGHVDDLNQKMRAEEIARSTNGVKSVHNELEVP